MTELDLMFVVLATIKSDIVGAGLQVIDPLLEIDLDLASVERLDCVHGGTIASTLNQCLESETIR